MHMASSLRKRLSAKNLQDLFNGSSNNQTSSRDESSAIAGTRPRTAATSSHEKARASSIYDTAFYDRPETSSGSGSAGRNRFSLLKNRRASDPQLSTRYHDDASYSGSSSPSACPAPVIGVTAPTWELYEDKPKRKFSPFLGRQKSFRSKSHNAHSYQVEPTARKISFFRKRSTGDMRNYDRATPPQTSDGLVHSQLAEPSSALAVPYSRVSASSNSTDRPDSSTGATSSPGSAASKFFTFARRRKKAQQKRDSLFPIPVYLPPSHNETSGDFPESDIAHVALASPPRSAPNSSYSARSPDFVLEGAARRLESDLANAKSTNGLSTNGEGQESHLSVLPIPPPLTRHDSTTSAPVTASSPMPPFPGTLTWRGRSNTMTSSRSRRDDENLSSETATRTSGSTTLGRNSIAGLRSLTRWRQSEPATPKDSPGPAISSRETLIIPDRKEGESAKQYYDRLEASVSKKGIALYLSKKGDDFSRDVLRSLLRTFNFFEEPIDISLRKFLWEVDIPGEGQQIDRIVQAFAQRYYECNPPIVNSFDDTYLVAFSLIMLHSDLFNDSNKRKMTRAEYQKNTRSAGIDAEILGCFYDNIQYTEFIKQDPDDEDSIRMSGKIKRKRKVRKVKLQGEEGGEKGKLDPYDFIVGEGPKLESLRSQLKGTLVLDDIYNNLGTAQAFDIRRIRGAFCRPSILQTTSPRSRPGAFNSQHTIDNPSEAASGIVQIKVAKVGILWRKDPKKKPIQSPWQEWGAILTQSQLLFFKDHHWVKDLMRQAVSQQKQSPHHEVTFKPPKEDFKADYTLKTAATLALLDHSYDKHKHGFVLATFFEGFSSEEVLLAENEGEMNDWIAKINFASTFINARLDVNPSKRALKNPLVRVEVELADTHGIANGAPAVFQDDKMHSNGTDQAENSMMAQPMTGTGNDENADNAIAGMAPDTGSSRAASDRAIYDPRKEMVKIKLEEVDAKMRETQAKLDEHLRTARHVQLLAPFQTKTRTEISNFGAVIADRVRYSRFSTWRWRTHSEVLNADLEDVMDDEPPRLPTPKLSPKLLPGALSRLNSKASAIMNSQKVSRVSPSPRRLLGSNLTRARLSDFAGGLDEAFATPLDTLNRSSSTENGPGKLTLTLDSEPLLVEHGRPASSGTDSIARSWSVVSDGMSGRPASSKRDFATKPDNGPTAETTAAGEGGSVNFVGTQTTKSAEGVQDGTRTSWGSAPRQHGSQVSFQKKMLRKTGVSGEGSMHSRGRRGKESQSSVGGGDDSAAHSDGETLARVAGSFKLHGKKASVITLGGSEWQNISAEDKLKAWKLSQAREGKTDVSEVEEDDDRTTERTTSVSEAGGLVEAAFVDVNGETIEYMGAPAERALRNEPPNEEEDEAGRDDACGGVDSSSLGEDQMDDEEESEQGRKQSNAASSKYTSGTSSKYFDAEDTSAAAAVAAEPEPDCEAGSSERVTRRTKA